VGTEGAADYYLIMRGFGLPCMGLKNDAHSHHISQRFNVELDRIRNQLMEMGGLVEQQMDRALRAIIHQDTALAEKVIHGDERINRMEIGIEKTCTRIIARRQPAASDLRLLITVSKAISDLERIGDEASKIARIAVTLSGVRQASIGYDDLKHIGYRVQSMTRQALTAFARLDTDAAFQVAQEDKLIDQNYQYAMGLLVAHMKAQPENIDEVMAIIWALRALERIGDHARNLAEDVVYLVQGEYVRYLRVDASL
jgi:phosphate transport system protein